MAGVSEIAEKLPPAILAVANQLPGSQALDFFTGFADGIKAKGRINQSTQRAKLFLLMACAPQLFEARKSVPDLRAWLEKKKLIAAGTSDREIGKVCKIVELRCPHQLGHP